jgi:hypothetical protein
VEPLPALLGATESIIAPKIRIAHVEANTPQETQIVGKLN